MKQAHVVLRHSSTLFLRTVLYLMGAGFALFGLLLVRSLVGGDVGEYIPVLVGIEASIGLVLYALGQTLQLLQSIDTNQAFSVRSVSNLRRIKYAAFGFSALYAVGSPYLYYLAEKDDAPGVLAIGLVLIGASFVIAVAAAVLQKLFEHAVAIKSENDLVV